MSTLAQVTEQDKEKAAEVIRLYYSERNTSPTLAIAIASALAEERERCAKIAFKEINHSGFNDLAAITAEAIRQSKE